MLRRIYSIILVIFVAQQRLAATNAEEPHQQQQQHPSLLVDTKYWIRDTEFGERNNWRDRMKPCTLLERIKMNEQSVVSMGDSMDALGGALESNIKELVLAMNGMLLLEEDTLADPVDSLFVQYLNESGDCFDSEIATAATTSQQQLDRSNEHLFEFEPDSDQMSWFNPDNWASTMNVDEINEWIPESHRIPCMEDIVVFGSRHTLIEPTIEAHERSKTLSFKVNFRPSQWANEEFALNNVSVSNLRVAKLKIGDQKYNQREFEELIRSNQYENIIFEFNDSLSVLKTEEGFAYPPHSLWSIDESSIQQGSSQDFCLDEAGCLCGNENTNMMKTICSFEYPLDVKDLPCYDPVSSSGYCNKICATVMVIIMDPTRFSEKFVANTLRKILEDEDVPEYFLANIFTGNRRTDDNKYEITFRHVPSESNKEDYESFLGREQELAQIVYEKLNNGATKSFYGIKTISIKSSIDWRRSNRNSIFWFSLIVFFLSAVSIFTYQESDKNEIVESTANNTTTHSDSFRATISDWIVYVSRRIRTKRNPVFDGTESFVRFTEPADNSDQMYGSTSEIPLVELDRVTSLADWKEN